MALPIIQRDFRDVEDIDFAVDMAYAGDPADFQNGAFRATLASAADPTDVLDFLSDVGAERRIVVEVGEPDADGVTVITFSFHAHWRLQQGKKGAYSGALLMENAPHAEDVAFVAIQLFPDPTNPRKS